MIKSPKDIHARRAALKALLNLTSNPSLSSALTQKGVLELVMKLTAAGDEEMRELALLCLGNLCGGAAGEKHLVVLQKGGCIPPLLAMTKSDNSECRLLALISLRRLSHAPENRGPLR